MGRGSSPLPTGEPARRSGSIASLQATVQVWVSPSRAEQPRAVKTLLRDEHPPFSTACTPLNNPWGGHVSCLISKAGVWTQDQALPTISHCPFLMTLGDETRMMMEYSLIIVGIYLDWPVASSQPHREEEECSSFANWTTIRSPGIRSLTLHTSCRCSGDQNNNWGSCPVYSSIYPASVHPSLTPWDWREAVSKKLNGT